MSVTECVRAKEINCKHSLETRTYTFDFRRLLDYSASERLDSVESVTADESGLNIGTKTIEDGQFLNVLLSGGTPETRYILTARASTDQGHSLAIEGTLDVE